jgi:predicted O-methyltransferase YrrM
MRKSAEILKEKVKDKIIKVIEVGVCAGQNAKKLQDNLRIGEFYLIDSYNEKYSDQVMNWFKDTHRLFSEDKRVTIIINNSLDVLKLFKDGYFDYIYLDASHNPETVFNEMESYWKKIKKGGMLAGHDYDERNPHRVKKAVEMFCKKYNFRYKWGMNDNEDVGDWYIWKK